jgi:hypothetical protein
MDDGVRLLVFNEANPEGVVAGTHYVSASVTDIAPYLIVGCNRLVVVIEDDCGPNTFAQATLPLQTCSPAQSVCVVPPPGPPPVSRTCCTNPETGQYGLCVNGCGKNAKDILKFFNLEGDEKDVSAAQKGGKLCDGNLVCCFPKQQTPAIGAACSAF